MTTKPQTGPRADLFAQGVAAHQAGRIDDAIDLYQKAISLKQTSPGLHYNLGLALMAAKRLDEAEQQFKRALALKPKYADALLNLGKIKEYRSEDAQAQRFYRKAAEADPRYPHARINLGVMLSRSGEFDQALTQFRAALQLDAAPKLKAHCHQNIGVILRRMGRAEDAANHFRAALQLDPQSAPAHSGVGGALVAQNKPLEAITHFEAALAANDRDADAWNNLGVTALKLGQVPRARKSIERAIELRPTHALTLSNLLYALTFDASVMAAEFLSMHKRWETMHPPVAPAARHRNTRQPERRLRVGYISSDFHDHAAAYYLEPLIAHHDPAAFEVFGLASNTLEDAVTDRIRKTCAHWLDLRTMTDAEAAEKIRALEIDVLVDCASHTRDTRLPIFLHKPAPIQVGTLLGHAGTTGLSTMDYLLSDPYITPAGFEDQFVERLIRLPSFFAPFRPRETWPEPHGLPPLDKPVFACVGHPSRICPELIEAWRRILEQVPEASIVIKSQAFREPAERAYWRDHFAQLGERIVFEDLPGGWESNMDFYGRVHAVLDTFPLNGSTSALIPLWMGVPVVTWAGPLVGQRCSASAVTCSGLPDLAVGSAEDYVTRAVALIRDEARLRNLRGGLRETMKRADFCNPRRLTAQIEDAYRTMWRTWCAQQGAA